MKNTAQEEVLVDVTPPKNFSVGGLDEAEITTLFETMLTYAGFGGRFTVRAEELCKGSPGKANTVRFQSRPVGATGMFMLYLSWQGTKPDTAFKGTLLSTEYEAQEMHQQLAEAYPSQTFVLSRDGVPKKQKKLEETSASNLFADEAKFRRAAKAICHQAEQDENCFVTAAQIEAHVKPIFPKVHFGRGMGVNGLLSTRGYIEPFDASGGGVERRFFVEPSLFHVAGMVHPDQKREVVPKPAPKETEPPKPEPTSNGNGNGQGMGALQLLKELRELRRKVDATEGMQEEIDTLLAEKSDLTREISKAEYRIKIIEKAVKDKQKEMNDPDIAEARETLKEFEILVK